MHPKIHCQGWLGTAWCFAAEAKRRKKKKSSCRISGRKNLPAPRGGKDQKGLTEAVKKKNKKTPQNPTKVLKSQSSEVSTRDPG